MTSTAKSNSTRPSRTWLTQMQRRDLATLNERIEELWQLLEIFPKDRSIMINLNSLRRMRIAILRPSKSKQRKRQLSDLPQTVASLHPPMSEQ